MAEGRVVVAGGTGFIGSALCSRLAGEGHEVTVLTRTYRSPDGPVRYATWAPEDTASAATNQAGRQRGCESITCVDRRNARSQASTDDLKTG